MLMEENLKREGISAWQLQKVPSTQIANDAETLTLALLDGLLSVTHTCRQIWEGGILMGKMLACRKICRGIISMTDVGGFSPL